MMSKRWQDLDLLLVGCGSIGRRHARVLSSMGVKNIWVCDPISEQVRTLQAEVPAVQLHDS